MSEATLLKSFGLLATAPGGVARLRELILTLAVQGQLVHQDPKDEPASALLKRVRAAKDRLIAEGRIKRDKPLPAIAEEEMHFGLPAGWEWVRLNDLAFPQAGFAFKSSGFNEVRQGLPLIRIRDVGSDNPSTFFSGEYRDEFIVEPGDWLISMDGEFRVRAWVGPKALLNQRVTRLMFYGDDLFQPFITSALQFRLSELQGTKAYTTVDHLSGGQIASSVVALPPLAEQARIVARVEELMKLCDALEEKGRLADEQHTRLTATLFEALANSESAHALTENWELVAEHFDLLLDRPKAVDALEQTILQLAVRGLLVPQDSNDEPASELLKKIRAEKTRLFAEGKIRRDKPLPPISDEETPFSLPKGWAWARFPELGQFGRGKSKHRPRNDPALFNPPIYPVVQTGEVARAKGVIQEFHSKYSEVGLAQSRLWPKGTLCITIAANIADSAILGFDACFPDSVVGYVPADVIGDASYFLAFMETARSQLVAFAPATAQKNINLEILESVLIPTPPLAEMSRIVAQIASLRRLCGALRKSLDAGQSVQSRLAESLVAEVV